MTDSLRVSKLLVWALCLSQGLVFIMVTPLWEGWDEAFHYSYIQTLVETRTLPVLRQSFVSKELVSSFENAPLSYGANLNVGSRYTTFEEYWKLPEAERHQREKALRAIPNEERRAPPPADARFASYEVHHAPLYYLVSAPVYALFSSSDLLTRAFVLRLFSLLLGSLTLPLLFGIGHYLDASTRHIRVAALLVALLPLLYPTIGRISNDSLAVPLFTGLVLMVLRYFRQGQRWSDAIGVGLLLGLGLLTKAYFLTALPALAVIFLVAWFAGQSRERLVSHAAAIVILASTIAGWWYVRNYTLYGNVSGMQELTLTANLSFMDRLAAIGRVEWFSSIRTMLKQHIWLGNTSLLALSRATYQVGYWLILLAILGGLKPLMRLARLPRGTQWSDPRVRGFVILGIFYGFFVAGVLYHMLVNYVMLGVPDGTGGWYMYAVIAAEVLLLTYGMESFFGRWAALGDGLLLLYVLVVNFLSLFCKSLPFYAGIFIPRFHLSHLLELYSPSGLKTMLTNLAVNKPSIVTAEAIGTTIAIYVILLAVTVSLTPFRRDFFHSSIGDKP